MSFLGPFPEDLLITRLREQLPELKLIGGAADLATALEQAPAAVPAAFVVATETSASPYGYSGGVLAQKTAAVIGVVLFGRNYAKAATGEVAAAELRVLRARVRSVVINWSPQPGVVKALSHMGGRNESYKAGRIVAQELFRSDYTIQVGSAP